MLVGYGGDELRKVAMAAPSKFAHVVYRTHRYEEMIDWYALVFEARVQHGDDQLTFMTYDDEHHRFAFVNMGPKPDGADGAPRSAVGVDHLAYTWASLDELVDLYKRLKANGITPKSPIKHGMTLSLYYADPEGNNLEFQVDLCDVESANEFMASEAFSKNPIGEVFDPDEFVEQYEAGVAPESLVFRSDQEPMQLI